MATLTQMESVWNRMIVGETDVNSAKSPTSFVFLVILWTFYLLVAYGCDLWDRRQRRAKLLMPLLPISERRRAQNSSPAEGTSFLHLPREIRQEILIEAYISPFPTMSQLQYQPSLRQLVQGKSGWRKDEKDGLEFWFKARLRDIKIAAQYLRCVHSVCNADMDYVVESWIKKLFDQMTELEGIVSRQGSRNIPR